MATSIPQPQDITELNDHEKEITGLAIEEAQKFLTNNNTTTNNTIEDVFVYVAGVIKNSQARGVELLKTFNPKGSFIVPPPARIGGGGGGGAFLQQGAVWTPELPVLIEGSVGGVVYSPFDKDPPSLGWLLAWDRTGVETNASNKVYVEAGSLTKIMAMEWSEIQQKLEASATTSRYLDRETGAIAAAQIKDQGSNVSLLGANFDFIFIDLIIPSS